MLLTTIDLNLIVGSFVGGRSNTARLMSPTCLFDYILVCLEPRRPGHMQSRSRFYYISKYVCVCFFFFFGCSCFQLYFNFSYDV